MRFAQVFAFSAILAAQTAPPKPILGTVTQFKADTLEIGVKPDTSGAVFVKVGPETQVVRIPPGERDLEKARPVHLTDLALGDRVFVSFVEGMGEARRIVLISARDIASRDEAERLDWQKRGISGIVASKSGNEITLEMRTPLGIQTTTVTITGKTTIRRYAPDSVKFADATPSTIAEIITGDQFRARGERSAEGTMLSADDVVFGTFLTRVGSITAVNREAGEIVIEDLAVKKPLTIRLSADSKVKMLPDMRAMFGPAAHGENPHAPMNGPADILKILERLPSGAIENLKVGGGVIVTSTRGVRPDQVTAILLLANADSLIQMARKQAAGQSGKSAIDVISGMHGGMLGGPGGLNLPTMIP